MKPTQRLNGEYASNSEVGLPSPVTSNGNNTGKGGRLGSTGTREQNVMIADYLSQHGYEITGGAGKPEEYLAGPGGGNKGSNYIDVTAKNNNETIRINTVDVYADGITPTIREKTAADSINNKTGGSIILIPKGAGLGDLPNIINNKKGK